MAYVTGVVLVLGCLLGLSFWPWYVGEGPAGILWTAHGWLYVALRRHRVPAGLPAALESAEDRAGAARRDRAVHVVRRGATSGGGPSSGAGSGSCCSSAARLSTSHQKNTAAPANTHHCSAYARLRQRPTPPVLGGLRLDRHRCDGRGGRLGAQREVAVVQLARLVGRARPAPSRSRRTAAGPARHRLAPDCSARSRSAAADRSRSPRPSAWSPRRSSLLADPAAHHRLHAAVRAQHRHDPEARAGATLRVPPGDQPGAVRVVAAGRRHPTADVAVVEPAAGRREPVERRGGPGRSGERRRPCPRRPTAATRRAR